MDSTNPLELTALWQRSHAHLRPAAAHLPLAPDQYHPCLFCPSDSALEVKAHLRFGPTHWLNEVPVLHCPSCQRLGLSPFRLAQCEAREPLIRGLTVTALDARLWSTNPTFLNIEPTTRCNFNCWYCVGRHMEQADIEVENFGRMLDNFPALKAIALVGEGEPLLHKGFFEMAHQAKARGIRVLMLSNGSAFSESVVRKICEAEIAYISISIDSIHPATFASSRIDGDLNRIWEGIERLRSYRDANGHRYPRIGLKGTLFAHTKTELLPIVEEAKRRGVELFESFQPLNPMVTYVPIYPQEHLAKLRDAPEVRKHILAESPRALQLLTDAQTYCREEGIPATNLGRPNGMRPGCDEEWLYSLLDGQITPCCQVKHITDPAWNLFSRPVDEILRDQRYENMRFNLWNGLFPDYCAGCSKTSC